MSSIITDVPVDKMKTLYCTISSYKYVTDRRKNYFWLVQKCPLALPTSINSSMRCFFLLPACFPFLMSVCYWMSLIGLKSQNQKHRFAEVLQICDRVIKKCLPSGDKQLWSVLYQGENSCLVMIWTQSHRGMDTFSVCNDNHPNNSLPNKPQPEVSDQKTLRAGTQHDTHTQNYNLKRHILSFQGLVDRYKYKPGANASCPRWSWTKQ